eukprot:TRINITY_DN2161_c0_g1_i2.p1 TRINITY_DN2161_c0_g1~~TRINITY_DN2161_c0_g1_i2.p1  ORF type:complete len:196 (-),score=17.63 TRINITY_DN2161_c0_g1_i2:547-1134(-)
MASFPRTPPMTPSRAAPGMAPAAGVGHGGTAPAVRCRSRAAVVAAASAVAMKTPPREPVVGDTPQSPAVARLSSGAAFPRPAARDLTGLAGNVRARLAARVMTAVAAIGPAVGLLGVLTVAVVHGRPLLTRPGGVWALLAAAPATAATGFSFATIRLRQRDTAGGAWRGRQLWPLPRWEWRRQRPLLPPLTPPTG